MVNAIWPRSVIRHINAKWVSLSAKLIVGSGSVFNFAQSRLAQADASSIDKSALSISALTIKCFDIVSPKKPKLVVP